MSQIDFSLILACYNEGPTFESNIELIVKELKNIKCNWEIVFVEDKSTDETKGRLARIAKKIKGSLVILHNSNQGRGRTVSDGIKKAHGKICGYMDVDCEIPPSYISLFIQEVENGVDVVVANRFYDSSISSVQRLLASRGYSFIVKSLLSLPISDSEAGFKFFDRKKILQILQKTKDNGWFWDTEICARAYKAGLSIGQIPVIFTRRTDKKSTVKLFRDTLVYAKRLITFIPEYRKL